MTPHALDDLARIGFDWLWETDADNRLTYLSVEAEQFLARSPVSLIGVTRESLAWDEEADDLSHVREAMAARRPFRDLVYRYRHPDGAPRWFEISGRPLFTSEGAFGGYRGVGSDVSDAHRSRDDLTRALAQLQGANAQLLEQNRRFDAALENMTQGLCMFDAMSRLVVWNRRYLEMYGLDENALSAGMSQREIIEILVALKRYKGGATVDSVSEGTRTSLAGESKAVMRELADGRVIAATHRPMEGGGWVATFEDVTERRRNEARILHMARHDALTDLPNRAAVREIGAELLGASADGATLAVLCLDLDRFKPVNDSYGHALGDKLLRAAADRLRAHVRGRDVVARLGGDEFAVLYRVADTAGAVALAQRLITVVSAPYDLDGVGVEIGMSIGIALADAEGRDIERLLKDADMALYEAKNAGRGIHCLFAPQMDEVARERLLLERELREALAHGSFELHYQPLVDLGRDCIKGVEALVRWRHPERGLVSPGVFIPLAEETGLIVPLGEWVLNQACRDAAAWPDHISVAVNVSPLQLRNRSFAQGVLMALASSGLKASRLELEITESVLLDDTEANLDTLHTLRRLGARISMDDFGTGYSSISYLRRFPFDKIKIDRSFVRDSVDRLDAGAIIRAIVGLGTSLGITTLVEGVETEEQLALVRAEGAQEMQGFLFSPPRPAAEITAMLRPEAARSAA